MIVNNIYCLLAVIGGPKSDAFNKSGRGEGGRHSSHQSAVIPLAIP